MQEAPFNPSGLEPVFETGNAETLAVAKSAFIDAKICIEAGRKLGLSPSAKIETTAPAILMDDALDVEQADKHMTPDRIWALDAAFAALHRECKGAFASPEIDLIAARYATLEFQAPTGKAALLRDRHYSDPTAVIQLRSSDPDLDRMIRSPIATLLRKNPALSVISIPIESIARGDDPRAPSPGFLKRLRFSGVDTLFYRIAISLSTRLKLTGPRGRIFVIRENELCKETSWHLFLSGFALHRIDIPTAPEDESSLSADGEMASISEISAELVSRHIGPVLYSERALAALTAEFSRAVITRVKRFKAARDAWRRDLDGVVEKGRSAVLTNWVNDTALIGLKSILEEKKVPFVFCQHGVTNEFNGRMRRYEAQFGTSISDLELVFNDRAVEIGKNNIFRRGRSVATGFPKDYTRAAAKGTDRRLHQPIWYLSTAFYVANHGQLEGTTDLDKCRHEIAIVEKVLAKIDHQVLFKPYPGRRFEDPDPVELAAEAAANIDIYRDRLDLRYIVGSARVLISARSFSTPSWCLATGKPLVHIDIPDQDPLDDESHAAFDAAVFLFDAGQAGFHDRLKDFLNQPIAAIEDAWKAKTVARQTLIETFIASRYQGAGKTAAAAVRAEIRRLAESSP